MSPQAANTDPHSKRIASDASHWDNWLERLAELRRANDGDEARQSDVPGSNSPVTKTPPTAAALD
jgi:hypothetical protein